MTSHSHTTVPSPLSDNLSTLSSNGVDDGNGEPTRPETVPSTCPSLRTRRPLTRTASIYHKCSCECRRSGSCNLVDSGIRYRRENELFTLGEISDDDSLVSLVSTGPVSISSGPSMPSTPAVAGISSSENPSSQERSPKRSFESVEPIDSNLSRVSCPSPKLQKREDVPLASTQFTVSAQAPALSQSAPLKATRLALKLQKPHKLFTPKMTSNTTTFPQYVARPRRPSLPNVIDGSIICPRSAEPRSNRRSLPSPLISVVKSES